MPWRDARKRTIEYSLLGPLETFQEKFLNDAKEAIAAMMNTQVEAKSAARVESQRVAVGPKISKHVHDLRQMMCSVSDLGKFIQNVVTSWRFVFSFWSGRWQCCLGLRHVFARYIKEASERICTCLKKETNVQNIGNLWVPCEGQWHQQDKYFSVIK